MYPVENAGTLRKRFDEPLGYLRLDRQQPMRITSSDNAELLAFALSGSTEIARDDQLAARRRLAD